MASKPYTWVQGIVDSLRVRKLGVVAVSLQGGEPVVLEIPKDDPRAVPIHDGLQAMKRGDAFIVGVDSLSITVEEADVIQRSLRVCILHLKDEVAKIQGKPQAGQYRKSLAKLESVHGAICKRLQDWSSNTIQSAKGDVR